MAAPLPFDRSWAMKDTPGPRAAGLGPYREFYERKAASYQDLSSAVGRREKVVLGLFPPKNGLRILDYGCGSGRFLRILRDQGHDVVGMDISETAVETVRGSGIDAVTGEAETRRGFDKLSGPFDVITALDVLEHTFDPACVIRNLFQILSKDGCFIASVPNVGCLPARATILGGRFPATPTGLFDSGHIRWFTVSNLGHYVGQAGGAQLLACAGTPLPSISKCGLWRAEKFQDQILTWLARHWPSLWGYQIVFKLTRAGDER